MERVIKKSTWEGEKIKGSRFIVNIAPVCSTEDAMRFLQSIIHQYKDAGHHCYAYRLVTGATRSSDDGEPRGSAGSPILQRLEHLDIVDVMVVVTRYFGGVKLGIGGLIRAYGGATAAALEDSDREEIHSRDHLVLVYSYSDSAIIQSILSKYTVEIQESVYAENICQKIAVSTEYSDAFQRELNERTAGRVQATNKEL